jgi:hypothetical protein
MKRARRSIKPVAAMAAIILVAAGPALGFDLLGVHAETGMLYDLSTDDGTPTYFADTGIAGFGSLELSPQGMLYGFTTGFDPTLYMLDMIDGAATEIGPLDLGFVFDGALVFAPDGTVYGTNYDSDQDSQLFTLDLATGHATVVGRIGGAGIGLGQHDINGMTWRSDGMLVGLDRATNALVTIAPSSAALSTVAALDPVLGAVGGMASVGELAYFTTGGPAGTAPGSNELYTIDLFTGETNLVGSLSPTVTDMGISGLAVPEPATFILLLLGGAALWWRR